MYTDALQFKSPVVRDMVWAICSPPLISGLPSPCRWADADWYANLLSQDTGWLKSLDADPAELVELVEQQRDRRLGRYFETLWLFWLRRQQRFYVLENNVQIIIDGETLGELDLILLDRVTGETLHWELAVKFYLGVGDTRKMANWHGPNLRDRLDIKVDHLMRRQSIIAQEPRVAAWLRSQGIVIDHCGVILKGRLYLPWSSGAQHTARRSTEALLPDRRSLPSVCSSQVPTGWWFDSDEFNQFFEEDCRIVPLIGQGWMERIPTSSVKKFFSKHSINETVSNKKYRFPLHVQVYNPDFYWGRAFIVDKNWPQKSI